MSNPADALLVIARLLSAVNVAIQVAGNSEKFRALVAQAVAENRDLSDDEIASLRHDAYDAVNKIGGGQ